MSARSKLRQALDAIDNAKRHLKRIDVDSETEYEIKRAIRELDDAESEIRRAIHQIPNE